MLSATFAAVVASTFAAAAAFAQEASDISIPVSVQYPSVAAQMEAGVPETWRQDGARTWVDNDKYGIRFWVTRSPFQTQVTGNTVTVSTTAQYWVAACPRIRTFGGGYICVPEVTCSSSLNVTVAGTVEPTSGWALRLAVGSVNVAPAPCMANLQGIPTPFDASPWIARLFEQWLRSRLASALPDLERRSSFKARAEAVWGAASNPIPLPGNPALVATLNPSGAALSSLSITDTGATANLLVAFSPEVLLGSPGRPRTPLPPLQSGPDHLASSPPKLVVGSDWIAERLRTSLAAAGSNVAATISTSTQGVNLAVTSPLSGRALLTPRLEGDRIKFTVASLKVDGVNDQAQPAIEQALRGTLASLQIPPKPLSDYLDNVPKEVELPLDHGKKIVLKFDGLRASSVDTDARGLTVSVAAQTRLSIVDPCSPPFEHDPTQFPPQVLKPGCTAP